MTDVDGLEGAVGAGAGVERAAHVVGVERRAPAQLEEDGDGQNSGRPRRPPPAAANARGRNSARSMAAPTEKTKQPDAKHTMDDDESWTSVSSQNDADQEDRPEREMPEELVRAPAEEAWLFQTDDLVDVRRTFARVCDGARAEVAEARVDAGEQPAAAAADRSPPAADARAAAAAGERELPAASYDTHRRGKRADGHSLRRRYPYNLEPVEEIETARRPAVGDAYPYSSGPLTVATTPLDALLPELLGTKWSRGHGTAALAKGRRWDDARELLDALVRDGRASADRGVVVRERGVYGLQAHVATRYKVLAAGTAVFAAGGGARARAAAKREARLRTVFRATRDGGVEALYALPRSGEPPAALVEAQAKGSDKRGRVPSALQARLREPHAGNRGGRSAKKRRPARAWAPGAHIVCGAGDCVRASRRAVAVGAFVDVDFSRDVFVTHVSFAGQCHDTYAWQDGDGVAHGDVQVAVEGTASAPPRVAVEARVGKGWLDLGDFRGPGTCFEEAAAALGAAPGASADGPWLGVRCRALRFRAGGAPLKVAAYGVETLERRARRPRRGAARGGGDDGDDDGGVEYVLRAPLADDDGRGRGRLLQRWAISHRERRYSREWVFGHKFGYRRRRRARRDLADQLRDLT